MRTLNVLGIEYTVDVGIHPKNDKRLNGCFGYCDHFAKRIATCEIDSSSCGESESLAKEIETATTLRHEIIHAFIAESGLKVKSIDEVMIDWLAVQFPKMLKAMQEVDAI